MENLKWWQTAVFYQIYPRSFADGNGDGIGDFIGMTAKLDYLKDLGIDALWLSPHFPSPQADCGYDVADYMGVAPEYGTLDDFKTFLTEAHRREIRVILDMVFNHTSDQHPWFIESRSSRNNPKRDWYVWRDPAPGGGPPNNWESTFTGSAWEYDETTGQYYYHFFLKEQPDLNWRNPEVKAAMWDAVRFWLDLGVDGYRLDAIGTIFEDPAMPDQTTGMTLLDLYRQGMVAQSPSEAEAVESVWKEMFKHQVDRFDEMHPLMKELRAVVDEYVDRMLVGEDDNIAYYGNGDDELHMVFNFPLVRTDRLTPAHIRQNQAERLSALPPGAWPCNTLGNHDSPRVWSRFGDGVHDRELAQLSLALMLTLRGTPFLYNGEEIGMTNTPFDDVALLRDTLALRQYDMAVRLGGMPPQEAAALVCRETRDVCRTPVQWANAPNAGFCPADVTPWLPVNPNYAAGVNVADQADDPRSMLAFYKRMLALRKQAPALIAGDYTPLLEDHADCLCFLRHTEAQTCLVVLNYSETAHTLAFDLDNAPSRLLFSSADRPDAGDLSALTIAPFEIYIAEL
ncbi:MAG TPA: alpha-glucosidase [Anaerolineae bacterium]|nr:alpha-glucosidase [Anaerolineae bacterium]